MSFRALIAASLLLLAPAAHSALAGEPMVTFPEIQLHPLRDQETTPANVKRFIVMTAARRGWVPASMTENSVNLVYSKPDCSLEIRMSFTTNALRVDYVDSSGMYYEVVDGETRIHPSYKRWVSTLLRELGWQANQPATANDAPTIDVMTVHYRRKAGDYAGWAIMASGTAFAQTGPKPKPVYQARSDDFGAVFILPVKRQAELTSFDQGMFSLRRGGDTSDCWKNSIWDHTKGSEIYLIENDCTIYYGIDAALKSVQYSAAP